MLRRVSAQFMYVVGSDRKRARFRIMRFDRCPPSPTCNPPPPYGNPIPRVNRVPPDTPPRPAVDTSDAGATTSDADTKTSDADTKGGEADTKASGGDTTASGADAKASDSGTEASDSAPVAEVATEQPVQRIRHDPSLTCVLDGEGPTDPAFGLGPPPGTVRRNVGVQQSASAGAGAGAGADAESSGSTADQQEENRPRTPPLPRQYFYELGDIVYEYPGWYNAKEVDRFLATVSSLRGTRESTCTCAPCLPPMCHSHVC